MFRDVEGFVQVGQAEMPDRDSDRLPAGSSQPGKDMKRIFVLDTDRETHSLLRGYLALEGFEVVRFERLTTAVKALESGEVGPPDAVILDPAGRGIDGLAVCHKLRDYTAAPIIILSSSYSEATVVAALQNGADEYLVKPISGSELVARLRAILRRNGLDPGRQGTDPLILDDLKISLAQHTVSKGGRKIDLSPTEFRLLVCLAKEPGKVLSHQALMARVWGAEYVESRHYLRLYIRYLRGKLEDDPGNPRLILSEWGLGYRFQPPGHLS